MLSQCFLDAPLLSLIQRPCPLFRLGTVTANPKFRIHINNEYMNFIYARIMLVMYPNGSPARFPSLSSSNNQSVLPRSTSEAPGPLLLARVRLPTRAARFANRKIETHEVDRYWARLLSSQRQHLLQMQCLEREKSDAGMSTTRRWGLDCSRCQWALQNHRDAAKRHRAGCVERTSMLWSLQIAAKAVGIHDASGASE